MDDHRPVYSLKAPGAAGSARHLPSREDFPRLDDHLVEPEVTRDEIIRGRRVVAMPAQRPHARQQTRLDYVVAAHVAPGYEAAADLLTRMGRESDFASDSCIYKVDPATGSRDLEEMAFEIVSEQRERDVTEKAEEMHRRGVRRIFAIFVKGPRRVCEWAAGSRSWRLLEAGSLIEDRCLVKPLAVAALLDAAPADDAVVEALKAKGNPALLKLEAAAETAGEARGKAEAILEILAARGVVVSVALQEEILGCSDLARLGQWLRRAAVVTSADELTAANR